MTDSSFFPFLLTLSQLVHEGPPLPEPNALFVLADAVEDSIGGGVKLENGEDVGIGLDVPPSNMIVLLSLAAAVVVVVVVVVLTVENALNGLE